MTIGERLFHEHYVQSKIGPELHRIHQFKNLEFVGSGHIAIDIELLTPPTESSAYVLVSIWQIAQLHETAAFHPLYILRESGLEAFQFTEANVYHEFSVSDISGVLRKTNGPLEGFDYWEISRLNETGNDQQRWIPGPLELNVHPQLTAQLSTIYESSYLRSIRDKDFDFVDSTHSSHSLAGAHRANGNPTSSLATIILTIGNNEA